MAQQKSERRELPQARRKAGKTGRDEAHRGGKAAPVEQETRQLGLWLGTAENRKAKARRANAGAEAGRPAPAPRVAPKPSHEKKTAPSTWMDAVCDKLYEAFRNVASNRGAPGPDRQGIRCLSWVCAVSDSPGYCRISITCSLAVPGLPLQQ